MPCAGMKLNRGSCASRRGAGAAHCPVLERTNCRAAPLWCGRAIRAWAILRAHVRTHRDRGSRPRSLAAPGTELPGVHVLRTLADADRIRAECAPGGRMVIIGGGYIGLEVAATARGLGLEVTVLEMAERVMSRVTCAQVSAFYESEHARQGVRILCNARVRALAADPRSGRVRAARRPRAASAPATCAAASSSPSTPSTNPRTRWPRASSSPRTSGPTPTRSATRRSP